MNALTQNEAGYLYAALMRGRICIPSNSCKQPNIIYVYTNPDNALDEQALSYFKRTIKALYANKIELAQSLFNWGLNHA